MAKSRFKNRKIFRNQEEVYEDLIESRQVKSIKQFESPVLRYPSEAAKKRLAEVEHIWSAGDKYWKLAARYYGDPKYWWVIAWYNLKPTDSHCRIGEVIKIPRPLERVLKAY